ncbi:MAG: sulfurtransferase complex subunit TusB [Methanosarcinales archaeon]
MKILHIFRNIKDNAIDIALEQSKTNDIGILLMHDAVLSNFKEISSCKVYALSEDVKARNISLPAEVKKVNYEEMVKLIFEYDKVISW